MKSIFKRKLRFLGLLLGICILILSGSYEGKISASASNYNKFTVELGQSYGEKGQSVLVPVNLYNLPYSGLSAASFVIEVDGDLMLNTVKPGNVINSSSDLSYSVRENKVYIVFSDSSGGNYPIKKEGTLCYLDIKINNVTSALKTSLKIRRIASDKEIFADNWLNKTEPDFIEGAVNLKDKVYKVAKDKVWKVTFSKEIDPINLNNSSVEIKDMQGKVLTGRLSIAPNGKTLEIRPPVQGYEVNNSYTITIKNNFTSKTGRKLSKEQKIDFYVEK